MATKAAKSITINATKYELANTLAMNDDKIQLLAKDVVLGEVELPSGGNALAMNNDKIQLLDNDVVLSEVELPSGADALFFRKVNSSSIEVKNSKGETISDKADAYAIIEKGGMAYAVSPLHDDVYFPMISSYGSASGFNVRFNMKAYTGNNVSIMWDGPTPFWEETQYKKEFNVNRQILTSLSELVVGDTVSYNGLMNPQINGDLDTLELRINFGNPTVVNAIRCQCICTTANEYGDGIWGMTFLASYNSEKYLIGLKKLPNYVWTIGSLKAL